MKQTKKGRLTLNKRSISSLTTESMRFFLAGSDDLTFPKTTVGITCPPCVTANKETTTTELDTSPSLTE